MFLPEERYKNILSAIRVAKAEQHLSNAQIAALSGYSETTVKNILRDEDGHRLSTLYAIADAIGAAYDKVPDAIYNELDTLRKSVEDKTAQIESMRMLVHKQTKKLAIVVSILIVILIALCVALAFDFLSPGAGWIK